MMERFIQYTRAPDGIQIAYWTLGQGEPLIYMAGGPWNHIEVWEAPQCRAWYELLAANRMLVRYDARGTGLSQREVSDFSLDAYISDLEAVSGDLGLTRFDIFAAGDAGPAAISYAVRHPDRVSRLILWCAWAQGSDFQTSPRIRAWRGLIDEDWELMVDTCAHLAFGWDAGAIGRQAAEAFRANITRETAQIALEATIAADVTDLLPQLHVPTLVLHRDAVSWLPVDVALKLAAGIPGSRLALTNGDTTAPYLGDTQGLINVIEGFLGGSGSDRVAGEPEIAPKPAAPRQIDFSPSPNQRNTGIVEILPVYLRDGRIFRLAPDGSDIWHVTFEPAMHPGEVAVRELNRLDLEPVVIHSTSWRLQEESLVLTYVVVLNDPLTEADGFVSVPARPGDLAVGTAMAAPDSIDIEEVASHALRHLAWLAGRDKPIREALGDAWRTALTAYEPEPFSAFDLSGSLSEEDGCLLCTRFSRPLTQFVSESS